VAEHDRGAVGVISGRVLQQSSEIGHGVSSSVTRLSRYPQYPEWAADDLERLTGQPLVRLDVTVAGLLDDLRGQRGGLTVARPVPSALRPGEAVAAQLLVLRRVRA